MKYFILPLVASFLSIQFGQCQAAEISNTFNEEIHYLEYLITPSDQTHNYKSSTTIEESKFGSEEKTITLHLNKVILLELTEKLDIPIEKLKWQMQLQNEVKATEYDSEEIYETYSH